VTAAIFKHWELSETLINDLENIQNIFDGNKDNLKVAQILHIINTLCNISDPFNASCIERSLKDAQQFGFDTDVLKLLIETTKENLF
jgi:HD-like signal output (HDOD) protein